ncbi:Putative cyclin-D6-1 [Linum perenne]
MEFELENPLTNDHLAFSSLFLLESEHMPSLSYSQSLKSSGVSFRQEAVSSILQASSRFDPFLSYLAVNYLDRFLSTQGFPQEKPWVVRLLSISCISLAVKMMNRRAMDFSENLNNGGLIFDAQTIQRMETLILGALKWRMRSVTPFSFIPFFTHYFSKLKDPPLKQALRARAVEIILRAQTEVKLVGFNPSVIAASGLLSACHELFPLQFSCFRDSILSCSYVNKESMEECYKEMQELAMEEYESVMDRASTSDTVAVNVVDRQLLSSPSWSDQSETEDEDEEINKGTIVVSGSASCSLSSCRSSTTSTNGEEVVTRSEEEDEIMVMINGHDAKRRKINHANYFCN